MKVCKKEVDKTSNQSTLSMILLPSTWSRIDRGCHVYITIEQT